MLLAGRFEGETVGRGNLENGGQREEGVIPKEGSAPSSPTGELKGLFQKLTFSRLIIQQVTSLQWEEKGFLFQERGKKIIPFSRGKEKDSGEAARSALRFSAGGDSTTKNHKGNQEEGSLYLLKKRPPKRKGVSGWGRLTSLKKGKS